MTSSIEQRFLLIISGTLLVVVAPLFVLFLVLASEQNAKAQLQHLSVLLTGNSRALVKPLWDFDVASIHEVTSTLISDPTVRRVTVRDTSGVIDLSSSQPELVNADGLEKMTRPIYYKRRNEPNQQVGWIDVYYQPLGLFSAFDTFTGLLSGVFLIAILLISIAAILGSRLPIIQPLAKLTAAINATRANGSRHRVDWQSNDEIGRLARSFNEMQTQLEHEEIALKWAHEQTTEIYNRTPAMLFSTDMDERIATVSDYWLLATGFERRAVIGHPFTAFLHAEDRPLYANRFSSAGDGKPLDVTARFVCASGREMDVLIAGTRLPATGARPAAALSVMTDVTELRQSEQRNRRQAVTDHLTGLLNRQGFELALETGIAAAETQASGLSCLFIDLDRFKGVNDRLGHAAGDAVLRAFAERLKCVLPEGGIAGRLGGDEFAVIAEGPQAAMLGRALAARIVTLFDAPFPADGHEVRLSASIGLALYPQQAGTAEELLRKSDMAMYARKRSGKNGAQIFDPAMFDDTLRRSRLESHIEQALKQDGFEVWFQPIQRLADGRILGFEALLRLRHPDLGLVSPAEIIPLAEETGLIGQIGAAVLEKTLAQIRRLCALPGFENTYVAVNFSALQFDRALAARIAAAVSHHGLSPERLVVEITEAVLMDDNPEIRTTLEEISRFGCRIALDDFGSGYSSLNYLNRFPVDIVKIDQSFTRACADPSADVAFKSRLLIEGIAILSRRMEIDVIVEGVETQAQVDTLVALGVETGQGYHLARPMPLAELLARFEPGPRRRTAP